MLKTILGAIVIAALVLVGLPLLLKFFGIGAENAGQPAKNNLPKRILKWVAIGFAALGIAFLGGSYLAFVQGVVMQISVLATVGIFCLVIAAAVWVVRTVNFKQ